MLFGFILGKKKKHQLGVMHAAQNCGGNKSFYWNMFVALKDKANILREYHMQKGIMASLVICN